MLLLNEANVLRYLIRSGRIRSDHAQHWVCRRQEARWNEIFLVECQRDDGPALESWFVKQPTFPLAHATVGIDTEVQAYRVMGQEPALDAYLPGRPFEAFYDAGNRIMVLENLSGYALVTPELHTGNVNLRTGEFAREVGRMMGTFHAHLERKRLSGKHEPEAVAFPAVMPSLLRDRAVAVDSLINFPSCERFRQSLRKFLLSSDVKPLLDELEESWEFSHLIHGDAAFRNLLFRAAQRTPLALELRWVDWETAAWSDPHWDFALFFWDMIDAYLQGNINRATMRNNCRMFWAAYWDVRSAYPDFESWCRVVLRLSVLKNISYLIQKAITDDPKTPNEATQLATVANLLPIFLEPLRFFEF